MVQASPRQDWHIVRLTVPSYQRSPWPKPVQAIFNECQQRNFFHRLASQGCIELKVAEIRILRLFDERKGGDGDDPVKPGSLESAGPSASCALASCAIECCLDVEDETPLGCHDASMATSASASRASAASMSNA
ncbi:MAG: hypothetical protein ABGW87_12375 [Sphingomonadaceae bacterium]